MGSTGVNLYSASSATSSPSTCTVAGSSVSTLASGSSGITGASKVNSVVQITEGSASVSLGSQMISSTLIVLPMLSALSFHTPQVNSPMLFTMSL